MPSKVAKAGDARRQAKYKAERVAAGGRIVHAIISPRAARALAILEKRMDDGRERGVTTRAVEHALEVAAQLQVEQVRRQRLAGLP